MSSTQNITVLDSNNCFLSYTTPAKARKLLKAGKVSVFNQDPFTIKMKGDGETTMVKKTVKKGFSGSVLTSFSTFFSEEKDIYIQNLGSTNISLEFRGMAGNIYVSIPKTRKPMNLTQYVPFQVLAESPDFRRLVNRNPPIIRLMTEEEYVAYYEDLASKYNTTIEEEIRKANDILESLMLKKKPALQELQAEMQQKIEAKEKELTKIEEPNSRVVGLCARADKDNGDSRLSEREFLEELEMLEGTLTANDYEFLMSKGSYKNIKKYAQKQLDALTSTSDEE